jgi:hypothetical protein
MCVTSGVLRMAGLLTVLFTCALPPLHCVQANGNLVLYAGAAVIWQTNTAGL